MNKYKVVFAFFLCVIVSLSFSLSDAAYAGEPTVQVKETVDAILKILNNKDLKKPEKQTERRARIRETVGLHWKDRTPQERKEFVSLFSDLLESNYIKKIERYEDEKVAYPDEKIDGSYAVVKTKIMTSKEIEIPVDYKIFRKEQKWEVYDIVIEGVSLVNNYRNQFNQILRSGSFKDLIDRLKKKNVG
jgi:phospholipid transport system substrate-binding protein